MSKNAIYFDIDRCMGCYSCQLACKQENDLAPHNVEEAIEQRSPVWRRVIEIEQGEYGDETVDYVSLSCVHCADAPCVIACPTGALSKYQEDGRVLVDQGKCTAYLLKCLIEKVWQSAYTRWFLFISYP
jgi:Fe-S-cluster-containing dehydrogenase component